MDAANIGNQAVSAAQERQRANASAGEGDGGNNLNGGTRLAEDFDTFLQLLTTQLQNQDPLEPLKTQEFTNQLVQFAGVEQQINTNDKLDDLIDLRDGSRAATAVAFIGKTVEADSNVVSLRDGTADLTYELDANAESAAIQIANQEGEVVRTLPVATTAGRHEVTWDGLDGDGNPMPDGNYVMQLQAVDENNATVQGDTFTKAEVQGFEQKDGKISLDLGGFTVGLDDVIAVGAPADSDAAADSADGADPDEPDGNNTPIENATA